ncbi:helix-turn-helix domain-containing protein [Altererythrobacter aurantiacus]|uniref:Helix-turn-helix domain-containing protein n=1 Tax=Parapontixanthobacter aurantiacus TaxID=1463599 RepID=A0A844ZC68_9SPHN|nr:recombinase family protein [Parapontixanthobacter aurantiacus]MXO84756.1 helix-turn-helix domain-containing protein [Parapontixanthobacter aurantiacus]
MALVGYARVSSIGQSLEIQQTALTEAGCDKIFAEKRSGLSAKGREQLEDALDYVREGDIFIVTRLDRLARSVSDLFVIIERLQTKGVAFRCLQQSGVDTDSSTGRLMMAILGAVAAFEADIRKERQMEGIAKAKAAGVYQGRRPSIDGSEVRRLSREGMRPTDIARTLNIGRASVYRYLST